MPDKNFGERRLVINGRTLKYSGIFHISELFSSINRALQEKGYTLREKRHEDVVTENGRNIFFELRPYKQMTSVVLLLIKIKITMKNVTEQVQELRGNVFKFDKGDIEIVFDAWSYTDYENRWSANPVTYVISTIIDKIFVRLPELDNYKGEVAGDTGYVYSQIRSLLFSYRRRDTKYVSDEEVRKQIEAEIEEAQDLDLDEKMEEKDKK